MSLRRQKEIGALTVGSRGALALTCLPVLAAVITCPSLSFASSGAHHESSILDLIPYWINFALYLAVIYLVFRKAAVNAWAHRRADIKERLESAGRELAAMENSIAQISQKISSLDHDVAELQKTLDKEGKAEADLIRSDSERKAQRVREQAADLIRAERKGIETTVQRELTELVLRLAEEKLKSHLTAENDRERRVATIASVKGLIQ